MTSPRATTSSIPTSIGATACWRSTGCRSTSTRWWQDLRQGERRWRPKSPTSTLILCHAGYPAGAHRRLLRRLAPRHGSELAEAGEHGCARSRVSGWSTSAGRVESLRPWVLGCIEAFGVDRCMFATNWPVDRLFSSYPDLVGAYRVDRGRLHRRGTASALRRQRPSLVPVLTARHALVGAAGTRAGKVSHRREVLVRLTVRNPGR